MRELLVATGNFGKIRELRQRLRDLPFRILVLSDFGDLSEVAENGSSFAENAAEKAVGYALQTGIPALADDSGLEVEILAGRPGIHSARYAGVDASDARNISKLLGELRGVGEEGRKARFVCEIAISDSAGHVIFSGRGTCSGSISAKPRGHSGFGYDPIFVPEGYSKSFGELPEEVKANISHRAAALEKTARFLRDFLDF